LSAVALFRFSLGLFSFRSGPLRNRPRTRIRRSAADEAVPAYHAQAPQENVPAKMIPIFFTDTPSCRTLTQWRQKSKRRFTNRALLLLFNCDRSSRPTTICGLLCQQHGSGCGTCIYEDFLHFEQLGKGKTAAQIRAAIIKGEWKSVDATKYISSLAANDS